MKYQLTSAGPPTEALGAYSGYRVRLVATRNPEGGTVSVGAFFRGSESMPEVAVPLAAHRFESEPLALEWGYDQTVDWIDRGGEIGREGPNQQGDEPDPGTGHNG